MRLWRTALAFTALAAGAPVQKHQFGAAAGYGRVLPEDLASGEFWTLGAEGCLFCSGMAGAFLEYSHSERMGGINGIRSYNLGGGGLRLQTRSRAVRPFFDAGFGFGQDRFLAGDLGMRSHVSYGVILGAGATVWMSRRWYVRPRVRLFALTGPHLTAEVKMGVGVCVR